MLLQTMSYKDATQYLGFCFGRRPETYIENYINSGELKRFGRRRQVPKADLDQLLNQRLFGLVTSFSQDDYQHCLEFAVLSYYQYASHINLLGGVPRERGIGEWAEDFIPGKTAEIAFSKFIEQKFNIQLILDFSVRPQAVVGQDIVEVARLRAGRKVVNPPRVRTAVKDGKMKDAYLLIREEEILDPQRTSDVYVMVRTELSGDHLFRALRDHVAFQGCRSSIPAGFQLEGWVTGFAWKEELQRWSKVPGITETPRYVRRAGELRKDFGEWQSLVSAL